MNPLCFVLMPFGRKPAGSYSIDFDAVYRDVLKPAIEAAGLTPLRADEEQGGGIIHKQMFERLLLCDYAVADLTGANANVFYELGVRHAQRPRSTVLVFADQVPPPFDLGPMRSLPYRIAADGSLADAASDRARLTEFLAAARTVRQDSPLYELLESYPDLDHTKTDTFRDRVAYSAKAKEALRLARDKGAEAVAAVEKGLGPLDDLEGGVIIDLMLSYRAVATAKDQTGYREMVRLAKTMPRHLADSALVQEQLGFALNRLGQRQDARHVLEALIGRRGDNPETNGLLGRVLKDEWETLLGQGKTAAARAMLDKAIDVYRRGFEADWRDAYPGINAVTLMTLRTPPHPDAQKLLPVVRYSVERKIGSRSRDYWDCATMLELAVLEANRDAVSHWLGEAEIHLREGWEAETTARNIALIRAARAGRGEEVGWMVDVETELKRMQAEKQAKKAV